MSTVTKFCYIVNVMFVEFIVLEGTIATNHIYMGHKARVTGQVNKAMKMRFITKFVTCVQYFITIFVFLHISILPIELLIFVIHSLILLVKSKNLIL